MKKTSIYNYHKELKQGDLTPMKMKEQENVYEELLLTKLMDSYDLEQLEKCVHELSEQAFHNGRSESIKDKRLVSSLEIISHELSTAYPVSTTTDLNIYEKDGSLGTVVQYQSILFELGKQGFHQFNHSSERQVIAAYLKEKHQRIIEKYEEKDQEITTNFQIIQEISNKVEKLGDQNKELRKGQCKQLTQHKKYAPLLEQVSYWGAETKKPNEDKERTEFWDLAQHIYEQMIEEAQIHTNEMRKKKDVSEGTLLIPNKAFQKAIGITNWKDESYQRTELYNSIYSRRKHSFSIQGDEIENPLTPEIIDDFLRTYTSVGSDSGIDIKEFHLRERMKNI